MFLVWPLLFAYVFLRQRPATPISGLSKDLGGTDESNQRPLTVFVIASDMLLTIG